MTKTKRTPLTASQRVIKSNAALLHKGGKRMPAGYLQPHEADALTELVKSGYADSPLLVLKTALLDAHRKIKRAS